MRCFWVFTLLVATTGFIVGCGGSEEKPSPANEGGNAQGTTEQPAGKEKGKEGGDQVNTAPAEAVVTEFLTAAKAGSDEAVAKWFTPVARAALAKAKLSVAPQASDTARFKIVESRLQDGNIYVACQWIEQPTPKSEPFVSEMAWILTMTDEGWRVRGMAMFPFGAEEAPLLLDFEKPEEVAKQTQLLSEEIARRQAEAEKTLLR